MRDLDALAAQASELKVELGTQALAEVADLTLRIHQRAAREAGAILPTHMARPYAERRDTEQEGMRSAVSHIIKALSLLGYIAPPGRE